MLLRHDTGGGTDVLYRARHLAEVEGTGARIMRGRREVTYIHLLFEQHQIIFANGRPSESLYPGLQTLKSLDRPAALELFKLFPDLFAGDVEAIYGRPVTDYSRRSMLPAHMSLLT